MKLMYSTLLALAAGAFLSLPATAETNDDSAVTHTTTYSHGILQRTTTYNVDGGQKAPDYGNLSPAAGGDHTRRMGYLDDPKSQGAMRAEERGYKHRGHHKHHGKKHHRDHQEPEHKE